MKNQNAAIGKEIERLFKTSISKHPEIIQKIQKLFKIPGEFEAAISTGCHNEKVDVKIEFSCGRNIDANIKGYKKSVAFNQLTRCTLFNFCKKFNLNCLDYLKKLFLHKAKYRNERLVPLSDESRIRSIISPIAKDIVKWSLSYKKSREILVLCERTEKSISIYSMEEILKNLNYDVSFTRGGNILIGNCITLQRKGGNGSHVIKDKKDPSHPGNDLQVKLKILEFSKRMEPYLISRYYLTEI